MNFIDIAYASEHIVSTEEAAVGEGVLASLGINGTLFAFQMINFAIVAAILWFLILKPLTQKMAERKKMIDESIENVKKIQENLDHSNRDYQAKVDEAKVAANKVLEKASMEATRLAEETKNKARLEIEKLVEQTKESIKTEKEAAFAEIKKETVEFTLEVVEKLIGQKFTSAADKKLVEELTKSIKKNV